jgi:hypothetical protein
MVEVGNTKQQLKTQWMSKDAQHGEAGSEIHRDEIPLMYQQYVEQYFAEVHKPVPGAAKAAKGATSKGTDGKAAPKNSTK